jgi:dihydroorotate dehydrogenase
MWNALGFRGFCVQYLQFAMRISRWLPMEVFYEKLLRPLLFRLDPERAHELAVDSMALMGRLGPLCAVLEALARLPAGCFRPVEALGLSFPNAVGLAAGFDKNAMAWPAAAALGFGHVEVGTVTAVAQPGNPRPRVFRYPRQEAVINRMGFNNEGSEAVAARLRRQAPKGRRRIPIGVNIGKSRVAEIDGAPQDYLASFARLADHADYLVLNVSSPNTPGLRQLQDEARLRELVAAVLGVVRDFALDGLVATNTTLERPGPFARVSETGGLSGAPLRRRSTEIVRYLSRATEGRLPIIGVGGITDAESAAEKLDAGACLVQVYTGMIYRGPFFAAAIARGLADRQRRLG